MQTLIKKYNIPGPRYTSYPTVPYWDEHLFDVSVWQETLQARFIETNKKLGISLYIHLPFCESLCTFCGCHKRITKQHSVEHPYIETLLKEWQLYCNLLPEKPIIKELHLGGGTPTFFSATHLDMLLTGIFKTAKRANTVTFGFEGHPNSTTKEHLETLYEWGFTRVSFGIQDYAEKVQTAIHRKQTFAQVAKVTYLAKEIGYTSISHDLVYGLPFQTVADILDTVEKTEALAPDRISFYSYAHVPWIKGTGQRGFNENDVPQDAYKKQLFDAGSDYLRKHGYQPIGMDHFAKETDALYLAYKNGTLHRNFMGYTTSETEVIIGLGASSIGDCWLGFAQNEKNIEAYTKRVQEGTIPVVKGHLLTSEDEIIRRHILNLMCKFETHWHDEGDYVAALQDTLGKLDEMIKDQLIEVLPHEIKVTEKGKPFVRNVCMAFDLRMMKRQPESQLFSMTV